MAVPWVRIEDSFHDHPKVLAAGPRAVGLAVMALSYANRHLTDGHVTREVLRSLGGTRSDAAKLVKAGMWEVNGNAGWVIHDFAVYQPTRAQVQADRAAARQRMARVRANGDRT